MRRGRGGYSSVTHIAALRQRHRLFVMGIVYGKRAYAMRPNVGVMNRDTAIGGGVSFLYIIEL